MTNTSRENAENKGFWDGGPKGHGSNRESGGKKSGFPGQREQGRVGIQTDLEAPSEPAPSGNKGANDSSAR
jgi:hypothetical protein